MIECPKRILFTSGSWGCSYYIGVLKSMREKYGYDKVSKCKFGGISAGSLIALGAILNISDLKLEQIYLNLTRKAIKNGVMGKMSFYHRDALKHMLVNQNDYEKVNGKLYIGLTNFYGKFYVKNHWNSNKELLDTLHASFHIPYYTTYTNKVDKKIAIDGAFSRSSFKIDGKKTLIVGCMMNTDEGDIICKPKLKGRDVYKPSIKKYYEISNRGYEDFKIWNGTYKNVKQSRKNYMILSLYWILRYSEELF